MNKNTRGLPVSLNLDRKEISIGSWLSLAHPGICEIMANAGFQWLVIDMEHSSIGIAEAEEMIRVINLKGIPALVRVSENDPCLIKRVFDCGASAVIVPMVNTAQDAIKAVAAAKYPPFGNRGVGLARAQGYGTNFKGYMQWANNQSRVIVQIEHIKGVENMEEILSVEGVDGFIVGPYDLSASLGVPGEFDHPKVLEALEKVKVTMSKNIKPSGSHVVEPDVKEAKLKIEEGYSFLAFGVDFLWLARNCEKKLSGLKELLSKGE